MDQLHLLRRKIEVGSLASRPKHRTHIVTKPPTLQKSIKPSQLDVSAHWFTRLLTFWSGVSAEQLLSTPLPDSPITSLSLWILVNSWLLFRF